jgi:hypothetical protein
MTRFQYRNFSGHIDVKLVGQGQSVFVQSLAKLGTAGTPTIPSDHPARADLLSSI